MKITLSKSQWELIGKRTGWVNHPNQIKAQEKMPIINLTPAQDGKLIANTPEDREMLNKIFGKHEFCIFDIDNIEKKLIEETNSCLLMINGMSPMKYMRQKVLKGNKL